MIVISESTANNWISQVEADPRLQPIVEEIEAKYNLVIKIVDDTEWSSSIHGQTVVVCITDTARPLAAFAHELLHLRLTVRGYRHIVGSGNHDPAKNNVISSLLSALDNELQHHKMFPDFVDAGFKGTDFYADSDDTAHEEVLQQIDALSPDSSAAYAIFAYLPLIAPGGGWPTGIREKLVEQLARNVSPEVWQKLSSIKLAIDAWAAAPDLDPTDTIVTIFETLGEFDGTFIAENVDSYPVGVFIPRSMTQEDFEKLGSK